MGAVRAFASALGSTLALVVVLAIAAAIVVVRTESRAVGAPPDVNAMRAVAAEGLEAAIGKGGSGVTFDVTQVTTLYAKDGGPRIEVTAPEDQTKVVAIVDSRYIGSVFSAGAWNADAFWMEMRASQDAQADYATADFFARVLERDGELWRDDGVGWYLASESPGVGMDPATARLLPNLLRSLSGASTIESRQLDGRVQQGLRGTSAPEVFPGVIAADGASFTETAFQVECWFDELGRLVQLEAQARNLNQTTYDLVSKTVITFSYGTTGDPPMPAPTMAPEAPPTSEPVAGEVQP